MITKMTTNDRVIGVIDDSALAGIMLDSEPSLANKKMFFTVIGLGSAGHSRLEAILSDDGEKCGFELAGEVTPGGGGGGRVVHRMTIEEVG